MQSPHDGQVFRSLQALVQHLNSYAKAVGFQWRTRTSRKAKNNGEICSVRMVCGKEGANKSIRKNPNYFRPSLREGCDVSVTSSLQNDGWWKINKINLQHFHENDPNTTPFLQQYRAIPPHMWYPVVLNDRSGIEEEEEGPQEPSPDKKSSHSIDDAIKEDQPSFEAPFFNQGAITERDPTCQQSRDPAVNIELHWMKLRRCMNILIESNLDNINQPSDMERTVDILILHYSGDDIKTLILRHMKQLVAELKDRISFMRSSKESAQSTLENFHKENPDFLAILERRETSIASGGIKAVTVHIWGS